MNGSVMMLTRASCQLIQNMPTMPTVTMTTM